MVLQGAQCVCRLAFQIKRGIRTDVADAKRFQTLCGERFGVPTLHHKGHTKFRIALQHLLRFRICVQDHVIGDRQNETLFIDRLMLEKLFKSAQHGCAHIERGQHLQHDRINGIELAVFHAQERVRRFIKEISRNIADQLQSAKLGLNDLHAFLFRGIIRDARKPRDRFVSIDLTAGAAHHRSVGKTHRSVLFLLDERDRLRQGHRIMDVFSVYLAAFRLRGSKNLDKLGGKRLSCLRCDRIVGFRKGIFGFRFGSESVKLLRKTDDLRDRADLVALSSVGIACAVPSFHMLLTSFAKHHTRNIIRQRFFFARSFFTDSVGLFLQICRKHATVRRIFFVNFLFFCGKVILPDLIFGRNERFTKLMISTAFISNVGKFALHMLCAAIRLQTVRGGAGLNKKHLRIGSNANRLLSDHRSQRAKRLVPSFIFFSFPSLLFHKPIPFCISFSRKNVSYHG